MKRETEVSMKILDLQETMKISGGSNQETIVQNGHMVSTMHIPPHLEELSIAMHIELKDALPNFINPNA